MLKQLRYPCQILGNAATCSSAELRKSRFATDSYVVLRSLEETRLIKQVQFADCEITASDSVTKWCRGIRAAFQSTVLAMNGWLEIDKNQRRIEHDTWYFRHVLTRWQLDVQVPCNVRDNHFICQLSPKNNLVVLPQAEVTHSSRSKPSKPAQWRKRGFPTTLLGSGTSKNSKAPAAG